MSFDDPVGDFESDRVFDDVVVLGIGRGHKVLVLISKEWSIGQRLTFNSANLVFGHFLLRCK